MLIQEILTNLFLGHEGPVSSLKFSPSSNTLYSCSWDSTARIWNLFEGTKCTREVIKLGSDALSLEIREDGHEFAVATLNGTISFFNAHTGDQLGIGIEGKQDLGQSLYKGQDVKDKYKYFSTFSYSVDGEYVIAAGKSKYICIYNVKQKLLVKRIEISNNLSLDGFNEFISKRKIQEFGFNLEQIKYRNNESSLAPISLPGVIKSDYADREMTPIISVQQIRFSPTMRTFSLASTEGVIIYSLDNTTTFYPFELDASITTDSFRKNIVEKNYTEALIQAIKLNNDKYIEEAIETTPVDQIELIVSSLSLVMVQKLLHYFAKSFESTAHLEFYLKWILSLLSQHAIAIKNSLATEQISTLRRLQQALTSKYQDISQIVNHNRYNLKFIELLSKQKNTDDDQNSNDIANSETDLMDIDNE